MKKGRRNVPGKAVDVVASHRQPTLFIAASSIGSPTRVGPETPPVVAVGVSPGSNTPTSPLRGRRKEGRGRRKEEEKGEEGGEGEDGRGRGRGGSLIKIKWARDIFNREI